MWTDWFGFLSWGSGGVEKKAIRLYQYLGNTSFNGFKKGGKKYTSYIGKMLRKSAIAAQKGLSRRGSPIRRLTVEIWPKVSSSRFERKETNTFSLR